MNYVKHQLAVWPLPQGPNLASVYLATARTCVPNVEVHQFLLKCVVVNVIIEH